MSETPTHYRACTIPLPISTASFKRADGNILLIRIVCYEYSDSLQASADILQRNMESLISVTSERSELFSRIAVHPSTNYPGRTQEHILLQLLRKKPEPEIATAIDEGRKMVIGSSDGGLSAAGITQGIGAITGLGTRDNNGGGNGMAQGSEKEIQATWEAARTFCTSRLMEYVQNEADDPFTEEERQLGIENVRTGLKRSLDDDEGDDEDEDEDVMVIDRPPPPPAPGVVTQDVEGTMVENIMRLAARGETVMS